MAAEMTISSLVERLAHMSVSNKLESLEELKTAVAALPPSELRNILPNVAVTNVFDCLNTHDQSQQKICAEVLDRMLSSLSASFVLQHFHSHLLLWLNLSDDTLKALCLHQLARLSQETPHVLCQYEDLVLAVVAQLSSDCLDVGPAAAAVLTHIGGDGNGLQTLYSPRVVQKVMDAMRKNEVTRFRVYQMATDVSVLSSAALEASAESGILQHLVNETIQTDDVLVQLNAIELVSDLARSPHGLDFLDRQGVIRQLEHLMTGLSENPLGGLLLPGLIKFFGGLARHHPKDVLGRFDRFVKLVLSQVGGSDPNLSGVSVDTVGFIAATPEGKLALDKIGNPVSECIHCIGDMIQTGTSELKVRAVQAMANVVYLQVEDQTVELLNLTEKWFTSCMSNTFMTVWSIAQQPFLDLRIPAFHLLQSIALTPWGQKLISNAPGCKEFVLDRATETSKEGKQEKFELVKILAHSPTAGDILGQPYLVKLIQYYREGAFYVSAQSEVAMEGEG